MLLQVLPAQDAQTNDFEHLATLTETIKAEELFNLSATDVLWRLYHEEEVTLYDPQDVQFSCTCSRERCAGALKTLPTDEVADMHHGGGRQNRYALRLLRHPLCVRSDGCCRFVCG